MDTPENRSYIARHRLWLLGEVISMHLVTRLPEEPFAAVANLLRAERSKPTEQVDTPTAAVVNAAQEYLHRHQVGAVMEGWLAQLLDIKPVQPIDFSIDHFSKLSAGSPAPAQPVAEQQQPAARKEQQSPPPAMTPVEPAPSPAPATKASAPPPSSPAPPPTAAPACKVLVVHYSAYGHVKTLATSVVEGAAAAGAQVKERIFAETLPQEVLDKMHIPQRPGEAVSIADLVEADAIAFGFPTRFGGPPAQVQAFLDSTGGLWAGSQLAGKVAGTFTSSNTQHGGQEATILRFNHFLLHHGMLIVGARPITSVDHVEGSSPYGPSTIAGDGRDVSAEEKRVAMEFGKSLALVGAKLSRSSP